MNKIIYLKQFTLMLMMGCAFFLAGCGDSPEPPVTGNVVNPETEGPTKTVWEIISENAELSKIKAELDSAGFKEVLSDTASKITLFAPTNKALDALLETIGLENFQTVRKDLAVAVLAYHTVEGEVKAEDLVKGDSVKTRQGEYFSMKEATIITSGATAEAKIQSADSLAINGVVHLIDAALVPPTTGKQIIQTLGTLAQGVLLGKDLTTLAAAVTKADTKVPEGGSSILSTLIQGVTTEDNKTKKITLFAPVNAVFEQAPTPITIDTYNEAEWRQIILNHIVVEQGEGSDNDIPTLVAEDMSTGKSYNTLASGNQLKFFSDTTLIPAKNGIGIYIDSNGDVDLNDPTTFTNFDAEVANENTIVAGNGRTHVIAGILAPKTQ